MPAFEVYGPDGPVSREFDAVTADGVRITHGLWVWTNNLDRGPVDLTDGRDRPDYHWHDDFERGVWWFTVRYDGPDGGGSVRQDGERVARRWRGELA